VSRKELRDSKMNGLRFPLALPRRSFPGPLAIAAIQGAVQTWSKEEPDLNSRVAPMTGRTISHYHILEKLGKVRMGVVFQTSHAQRD